MELPNVQSIRRPLAPGPPSESRVRATTSAVQDFVLYLRYMYSSLSNPYGQFYTRTLPDIRDNMLLPLDPRILSALMHKDNNNFVYVLMIKRALNKNRNLSLGVQGLLNIYPSFNAQLWPDEIPNCNNKTGADSWHISFRVCMLRYLEV